MNLKHKITNHQFEVDPEAWNRMESILDGNARPFSLPNPVIFLMSGIMIFVILTLSLTSDPDILYDQVQADEASIVTINQNTDRKATASQDLLITHEINSEEQISQLPQKEASKSSASFESQQNTTSDPINKEGSDHNHDKTDNEISFQPILPEQREQEAPITIEEALTMDDKIEPLSKQESSVLPKTAEMSFNFHEISARKRHEFYIGFESGYSIRQLSRINDVIKVGYNVSLSLNYKLNRYLDVGVRAEMIKAAETARYLVNPEVYKKQMILNGHILLHFTPIQYKRFSMFIESGLGYETNKNWRRYSDVRNGTEVFYFNIQGSYEQVSYYGSIGAMFRLNPKVELGGLIYGNYKSEYLNLSLRLHYHLK